MCNKTRLFIVTQVTQSILSFKAWIVVFFGGGGGSIVSGGKIRRKFVMQKVFILSIISEQSKIDFWRCFLFFSSSFFFFSFFFYSVLQPS